MTMDTDNGHDTGIPSFDKNPMQSKKFVAYLVAEGSWKIILGLVLVMGIKAASIDMFLGSIAIGIIIVAGFIEAGYIIGQSSLDKYIGVARIAAAAGQEIDVPKLKPVSKPKDDPNQG